jgi:RNA polymerase sigma factor (sigma-70 family)
MSVAGLRELERDLDRLFRQGSVAGTPDARLLERFVADGDAEAFEALVARHQEMLLRTCHDLLGDAASAEEVFQATLVIFMRRAGSIRRRDALGSWLHRVACRVARRSRVQAARRRTRERCAGILRTMDNQPACDPDPLVRDELRIALHEEIDRLPDKYRRPVIACLLEGLSHERAAAQLAWTEGSLRGRLARGKARLRERLTRRGIGLAAVLTALGEPGADAAAHPLVAVMRTKAAIMVLSALSLGSVLMALTLRADGPQKTAVVSATSQPAPRADPGPKPEPDQPGPFRGGGPTNESRATALPTEVAARPVDFRGRVLDPSAKGVAGARISLITDAWSVPEIQATSARDGTFHFTKTVGDFWRNFAKGGMATPHEQAVVLATHDSFGVAWSSLKIVAKDGTSAIGGEYPLTLRMVADRPIEGRLIDDRGSPIPGAEVRVEQFYAVPKGDLAPVIDALRKFDLGPYQTTHPRIMPNNLAAPMAIPATTTGPDGRFKLTGIGRDRQANLVATGPGMASMQWTVLNRDDAIEVTEAVRARWPHKPKPDAGPFGKGAPEQNPGVQVYGPAFDLRVDPARTFSGVVREAATGQPIKGVLVYYSSDNGYSASATTDDHGQYRIIRQDGLDQLWLAARPPEGSSLLGVAREYKGTSAHGELAADFSLPRGVVVSGRAVERETGRPMLATRSQGCHGPGPIMGGRIWYRPLVNNDAVTGSETGAYLQHGVVDQHGLYLGIVEGDGTFRVVVPPGPGVLLLEAAPGMPFMWQFSMPTKEDSGLHRRFPYTDLRHRDPADGAPHVPGASENTLPGAYGPIALEYMVAYRVIAPAVGDAAYTAEISIPAARTRRVRFVAPEGRLVRGAVVVGLTSSPFHQVILDGAETEVIGLEAAGDRRIAALSPDGRYTVETTIRADMPEPIIIRMQRSSSVSGRLVDEHGKAIAGSSVAGSYSLQDPPAVPRPRDSGKTDAEGRFLVQGIFPGYPVTIEFYRDGKIAFQFEHFRPSPLQQIVLETSQTRDAGAVTAKPTPW